MVEHDSLMREIDDAVRQDRLMGLWNQFKMPLVYAAVALIVVTAGASLWNGYQQRRAEEAALAFEKAQDLYLAKRYDEAAKSFDELTHQTRGNLADMAKLWRARALLGDGKKKTALRALQNIILAPEGQDLFWRDLACVHIFGLVGAAEVPENCSGKNTSPLSPLLVQLKAANAWQEGDIKTAQALLDGLVADANVPLEARAQARALESTISAHASGK